MEQNYPNPFNPETTIRFAIPKNGYVTLEVYTLLGELVRTLINENLNVGTYSVSWDGKNDAGVSISSGVYLYRIHSEGFLKTQKMTLLK
jgi:flagellar hook assembly protein FlgD